MKMSVFSLTPQTYISLSKCYKPVLVAEQETVEPVHSAGIGIEALAGHSGHSGDPY